MTRKATEIDPQRPKRVAAVHDISCVGRCAMTVILPTLSVLGAEVCPLPTALLSTHTGGYEGFTFLDLTGEMEKIRAHWKSLGLTFDAVYSGFLGSAAQIASVASFVEECRKENPSLVFLADPVMGDDGKRYTTYTDEMCALTGKLAAEADIITPNVTEACLLLGENYRPELSEDDHDDMLLSLLHRTRGSVVLTGIERHTENGGEIGAAWVMRDGTHGRYYTRKDPVGYPGTGDLFASILLGRLLYGADMENAVRSACDFIARCAAHTTRIGGETRAGTAFEPFLGSLAQNI